MKTIVKAWKKIVGICDWLEKKTHVFDFALIMFNVNCLPVIILLQIFYP